MIVWYTLDIYNYTYQLFLNKVEGKKNTVQCGFFPQEYVVYQRILGLQSALNRETGLRGCNASL